MNTSLMVGNFASLPDTLVARWLAPRFPRIIPTLVPDGSMPTADLRLSDLVLSREVHNLNGRPLPDVQSSPSLVPSQFLF
jgi:hypothetical protein